MYKKAKKPLIYGAYSISTRMSFRDGRIMADVQHLPSGITSTVVFKNAQSINTSVVKMFNDGYNPLDHFTESQVVLIKRWDAEVLEAKKYFDTVKTRQRHIPTDYEKRIDIYKQQHGVLGDIDNNELYDLDKASKDYKNEVLINKIIRDNEHKGLKLRDAFLNKGVEPRDLNAILNKLRGFLRGQSPLSDENEAKEWIAKFLEAFKKSGGIQIGEMY